MTECAKFLIFVLSTSTGARKHVTVKAQTLQASLKKMRMKFLLPIFYLLTFTASGQADELILKSQLTKKEKALFIKVTITNPGEKSIFMNTSHFYIVSDICDSLCAGLGASLKSQSGELIHYNYPLTFIQSENAKQQIRHSARIDKRQQPKIKIRPKEVLLINKGLTKLLNVKIPLQHWSLKKGETYTVSLNYKRIEVIKEPKGSVELNYLTVEVGSFTYRP